MALITDGGMVVMTHSGHLGQEAWSSAWEKNIIIRE